MDKRDLGITIGICASLAVHVGVVRYSANQYSHTSLYYPSGWKRLPGVLVSLKPNLPPPPPQDDIGEDAGRGDASFAAVGDRPMLAPKDDETQALLTVNDTGQRSGAGVEPSVSPKKGQDGQGGPKGQAAQELADAIRQLEQLPHPHPPTPAVQPAKVAPSPKTGSQAPTPPPLALLASPHAHVQLPSTTQPAPMAQLIVMAPVAPAPPAEPQQPTPTHQPGKTASGDGRSPGASAVAQGDPAPHSDTDSDAFSKTGTVQFRNGHLDARSGRKVKVRRRPDILDHGYWDQYTVADPTVVLKISIDTEGNVAGMPEVIKSSGSNDIDLPTQRAVCYWWFEPRKDAKGQPVPDVIIFTIKYR